MVQRNYVTVTPCIGVLQQCKCTASLCVVRCHSWRQMLLDNVQRTPATTDTIQITLQQPKSSLLTYKLQAAYLTHHAGLTATNELRFFGVLGTTVLAVPPIHHTEAWQQQKT